MITQYIGVRKANITRIYNMYILRPGLAFFSIFSFFTFPLKYKHIYNGKYQAYEEHDDSHSRSLPKLVELEMPNYTCNSGSTSVAFLGPPPVRAYIISKYPMVPIVIIIRLIKNVLFIIGIVKYINF